MRQGIRLPIAVAGQAIDNNAVGAAQRWADLVILREGHRVVQWTDGYDPYGEEAYVPILAERCRCPSRKTRPRRWTTTRT